MKEIPKPPYCLAHQRKGKPEDEYYFAELSIPILTKDAIGMIDGRSASSGQISRKTTMFLSAVICLLYAEARRAVLESQIRQLYRGWIRHSLSCDSRIC